jgi:hypothetical protein
MNKNPDTLNTPKKTREEVQNSGSVLKNMLLAITGSLIAEGIIFLSGGILYHVSAWFNKLIRDISHNLIMPVLFFLAFLSVLLMLSYFGFRLGMIPGKPRRGNKTVRWVTRIAGLLGLTGLTAVAIAFIVSRNTPFKEIVMDTDTVHKDISFVLNRDVFDLWVKISGGPPGISVEIDRYSPQEVDREFLDISGLEEDKEIRQSAYYILRLGFYQVLGAPRAGDTLVLRTKKTSDFEGEIRFEFWDSPKEGAKE